MNTVNFPRGALIILLLGGGGCEQARLREAPPFGSTATLVQQSELVPGPEAPERPPLELRADERTLAEGERLYHWYNCAGCHFAGGGGIGPPLMDDEWIYGSKPLNIADTISEGRPNGMPAYGGRLPAAHLGPLVAYVRSLSGLGPSAEPTPTPLPQGERQTDSREKEASGQR